MFELILWYLVIGCIVTLIFGKSLAIGLSLVAYLAELNIFALVISVAIITIGCIVLWPIVVYKYVT